MLKTGEYLKTLTPASAQNPECIKQFLQEISRFNLRKAEKIVILNLRPETEIELDLVKMIIFRINFSQLFIKILIDCPGSTEIQ